MSSHLVLMIVADFPDRYEARLLAAIADPDRLRILALLERGSFTTAELAQALGLGGALLNFHCAELQSHGLVESRRTQAGFRLYRVESRIAAARAVVAELLERVREVQESRHDPAIGALVGRARPARPGASRAF